MKTKFKDFLLYSLACVGAVSLLLSVIDKPEENAQPLDTHHVIASNDVFVMYNTQTGEYKRLILTARAAGVPIPIYEVQSFK